MSDFHNPVLLKEVIELLRVKKDGKYIDATLGGGGHTGEILKRGGVVLGLDIDEDALAYVEKNFKFLASRQRRRKARRSGQISNFKLILVHGNFKDIDEIARLNKFEKADGIIFDLGVSTHQIESEDRGFSFQKNAPLDMRMDRSGESGEVTAADLLKVLDKGELYELFTKLGEEHRARAISENIVRSRGISPIETTDDLVSLLKKTYGIEKEISGKRLAEISKRVFQALRIAVNSELKNIEEALPKAIKILKAGGRIGVVSFHSLEDRIVKTIFNRFMDEKLGKIITDKPITPSYEELKMNRRSRSAKLRVFEKNN
ncbi:MAG: 16S rRNA (cytosine(1402)-N(4))-methyltransferase RsmH [Patescibacteria group bacterium]|nr:16S rRNA (cytosine(1402)-N(4))-methyltransferase RsmH [Patescibacteria group bacterium]